MAVTRPPFDPELETPLSVLGETLPPTLDLQKMFEMREAVPEEDPRQLLADVDLETRDVTITGYLDAEIIVSVVQRRGRTGTGPGIYHTHGGGMIEGDRWRGVDTLAETIHRHNAVLVTVEYRLAPEHPDPIPVEDCYAGLLWTSQHARELGIDPSRLLVAGASAGGGLAAGIALLARDRGGPPLCGQLLMCPMLDDRDATTSSIQIDGVGVWDRASNVMGWTALARRSARDRRRVHLRRSGARP